MSQHAHLYNNRFWRSERMRFLQRNPLCAYCDERGVVTAANIVNHHVPHRGDVGLFWDRSNWRACCQPCHDRDRQIADNNAGRVIGHDADGVPLDPAHPWRIALEQERASTTSPGAGTEKPETRSNRTPDAPPSDATRAVLSRHRPTDIER